MSTTSASATEPTKAKYSAVESEVHTSYASQWWIWILGALIILSIGYIWHARRQAAAAAAAAKAVKPMVPVSAVHAQRGDLNLYLTALGSVSPFNTATIKSRVDGTIVDILFKEGQTVKEGHLLIQIDPRPYQVQLTQAQGTMAKDEATF